MTKKKLYERPWTKLLAFFLCCLFVYLLFAGIAGIIVSANEGFYARNVGYDETELCRRQISTFLMQMENILLYESPDWLDGWSPSPAFAYRLTDSTGQVLADTTDAASRLVYAGYEIEPGGETNTGTAQPPYTLDAYVQLPVPAGSSMYPSYLLFLFLKQYCRTLIGASVALLLAAAAAFFFLLYTVGRVYGEPKAVLRGANRVPFDVYLLLTALAAFAAHVVLGNVPFFYTSTSGTVAGTILLILIYVPLFLGLCMTFAARLKAGGLIKGTALYRLLAFLGRTLIRFFRVLPLVWKTVIAYLLFISINLICLLITVNGSPLAFMFISLADMAVFAGLILCAVQLRRIRDAMQTLADGDLSHTVDTENLLFDLKDMGESINRINSGMTRAVDARLRSERFKTELITNVSHDLKTPLTSIVSYVDLLKKADISDPDARTYIDVLDRQSAKLKKLTEDLVEASKASSGVIPVNKTELNVTELLSQSVAEYGDRFERAQITPILTTGDAERTVVADGRLLWRVFDNLLQNICKYAMPGTRAYIDVAVQDVKTAVTFKNISADALNISSAELMERFVRGDQSRHTEGSGLGLSIARSLTELQGGTFELQVDGDLFKAIVTI